MYSVDFIHTIIVSIYSSNEFLNIVVYIGLVIFILFILLFILFLVLFLVFEMIKSFINFLVSLFLPILITIKNNCIYFYEKIADIKIIELPSEPISPEDKIV